MKNSIVYAIVFGCIILLFSCEDFVELEQPNNQIANPAVFNSETMTKSALNNVYVSLINSGFLSGNVNSAGFIMACHTDELKVTTTQNLDFKLFYEGNVFSNNNTIKKIWGDTYKQIYNCNLIIEGVENSTTLSSDFRNQIIGECLTIRGVLHMYLAQTFGNVPYVHTTDYNLNKQIGKDNIQTIMQKAIDDLQIAENLLNANDFTSERIYINKSVAQAFLARFYLYQENWNKAKQYAELVLNNPNYELEPIEKVFLKDSKSAIWQLKPLKEGANTYEAYSYIFSEIPAPNAQLSLGLLDAFEAIDLRKNYWIKTVDSLSQTAHANKYKIKGASASSQEYSIIIRVEEMYLIASEASAEMNDWEDFNGYLNALRSRSNSSDLNLNNLHAATEAILNERRMEFFCEFGHRFYDLKRKRRLDILINTKLGWKPFFQLFPVPENELVLNPNLKPQNDGY